MSNSELKTKPIESIDVVDFLENASLSLHCVDAQGIIKWANDKEVSFLGFDFDEYVGQPIEKFHADKEIISDILTRLTNNETLTNYPAKLICKDGKKKDVLISSNVCYVDGKFSHTRCFTVDITEQKRNEKKLYKYAIETKIINKELENYAYLASHQLKEPLRGIYNYTSMFIEENKQSNDKKNLNRLNTVLDISTRMEELINALLHYSHIGTEKSSLTKIDLNILIEKIQSRFKYLLERNNISLRISKKLPFVLSEESLLTEVIQNLIENSIKYNDKENNKWVEVGFIQSDSPKSNIFYVKDNGIGIKEKYTEKAFDMFKRLPSTNKITKGTGIGLSIVKKILEHLDEKIWIESTYGEGTTVYFTLSSIK
jgi:PAS domain S-box-containing protein